MAVRGPPVGSCVACMVFSKFRVAGIRQAAAGFTPPNKKNCGSLLLVCKGPNGLLKIKGRVGGRGGKGRGR